MLKFNHEEIDNFINNLDTIIDELYEERDKCEIAKEDVAEIASGKAIDKYSDYTTDLDDYQETINLYESVRDDLQEFYDTIDDRVFYNTEPTFYFDENLKDEIKDIGNETKNIERKCKVNIANKDYAPFEVFNRGNILHKGSPEEELIDSNDGKMKDWAIEINKGISKLVENIEQIEYEYDFHFKDLEDDSGYSKYHEDYEGLSEEHHEWVKGVIIIGGAIVVGVAAYSTGVGEVATAGIVAEGVASTGEATAVGVEIAEGVETTAGVLEVGEATEAAEVVLETEAIATEIETVSIDELPKNVQESYKNYTEYTTKKGKSPWNNNAGPKPGKAGQIWGNEENKLPKGNYTEYDVNPKTGPRRDGERFIRNDNSGEIYYTADHYNTFLKIGE